LVKRSNRSFSTRPYVIAIGIMGLLIAGVFIYQAAMSLTLPGPKAAETKICVLASKNAKGAYVCQSGWTASGKTCCKTTVCKESYTDLHCTPGVEICANNLTQRQRCETKISCGKAVATWTTFDTCRTGYFCDVPSRGKTNCVSKPSCTSIYTDNHCTPGDEICAWTTQRQRCETKVDCGKSVNMWVTFDSCQIGFICGVSSKGKTSCYLPHSGEQAN
jgi:hypothetical protein